MINEYLLATKYEALIKLLENRDINQHFSVIINFVELFEDNPNLGNSLLKEPEIILPKCDDSLREVQKVIIDKNAKLVLYEKPNVHARIYGLPRCPELHRTIFPKNQDLGRFLQISGTVVRMTAMKMLEYKREYICIKCKYKEVVDGEFEQRYEINTPKKCKNPDFCKGTKFLPVGVLNSINCKDYQEIKMQEKFTKLESGSMPNSMWVALEYDLVDSCKPGDDVTICGTLNRRWKPLSLGKRIDVELVFYANHVQVNNDSSSILLITPDMKEQIDDFWKKYSPYPLYGRDLILRSFCPQIFGMYFVKLAMVTVLSGGSNVQKSNDTGVSTRSEPHLLLVGDPGTGKSQLLKYAAKVIPRSVLTTGIGSTSAGLTVAAVMEDGEWQLEAGALVLADGGICCIDEFNSMKAHDRTSIHEAMEQQTISVAKASICCKLSTKCSILAATNPKGSFDSNESISMNIALASPLLSRFDLVLLLKDNIDSDWDESVADFILRGHKYKSKFIDEKNNKWSLEMLQAYFMMIKKINPLLTDTSNRVLSSYYQLQRKTIGRNKARTTVRLLDSLVRLSQAHARFMCHTEVQIMDAIAAVSLVEASMEGDACTLSLDFDIHSCFPENPMETYKDLATVVLEKLGLLDILDAELIYLKNSSTPIADSSKYFEKKKTSKSSKQIDITVSQIRRLNDSNNHEIFNFDDNKNGLIPTNIGDETMITKNSDTDCNNSLETPIKNNKHRKIANAMNGSNKIESKKIMKEIVTNLKESTSKTDIKRKIGNDDLNNTKKIKSFNDSDFEKINFVPRSLNKLLECKGPDDIKKQYESEKKHCIKIISNENHCDKITAHKSFSKSESGKFSECSQLSTTTIFEDESFDDFEL